MGWRDVARWPVLIVLCAAVTRAQTCLAPFQTPPPADAFQLASDGYYASSPAAPRNEQCTWVLALASAGAIHEIVLGPLSLQTSFDFVKIYDGPNTTSPLLAGLRNALTRSSILYSTTSMITVEYVTGPSMPTDMGVGIGFALNTSAVTPSPSLPSLPTILAQTLVAVVNETRVFSGPHNASVPGFDVAYQCNITITVTFVAPPGMVIRVALGSVQLADGDSLVFYDNGTRGSVLESITGKPALLSQVFSVANNGPDAATVGSRLVMVFHSGPWHKFSVFEAAFMTGFTLDYTAMPLPPTCTSILTVTVTGNGTIDYPSPRLDPSTNPTFAEANTSSSFPPGHTQPRRFSFQRHTLRPVPDAPICGVRLDAGVYAILWTVRATTTYNDSMCDSILEPHCVPQIRVYQGFDTSWPELNNTTINIGRYAFITFPAGAGQAIQIEYETRPGASGASSPVTPPYNTSGVPLAAAQDLCAAGHGFYATINGTSLVYSNGANDEIELRCYHDPSRNNTPNDLNTAIIPSALAPLVCSFHLVGMQNSAWTSMSVVRVNASTTNGMEGAYAPRVRIFDGSSTSSPLIYDSMTDSFAVGYGNLPPGVGSTGRDVFIQITQSQVIVTDAVYAFRNVAGTAPCVSTTQLQPADYTFTPGTLFPATGWQCTVELVPTRGLNSYLMTIPAAAGGLGPGEFVRVYQDGLLVATFGHVNDAAPLTLQQRATRVWLTPQISLRITFDAAATSMPSNPARDSFQLQFTVGTRTNEQTPVRYNMWPLYSASAGVGACAGYYDGTGPDTQYCPCIMVARYQSCSDVNLPNLEWAGIMDILAIFDADLPHLKYIDTLLCLDGCPGFLTNISMPAVEYVNNFGFGEVAIRVSLPGIRYLSQLIVAPVTRELKLLDMDYIGRLVLVPGDLTAMEINPECRFGDITIPPGMSFVPVFSNGLSVDRSASLYNVSIVGNLTVTSDTADVNIQHARDLETVLLRNATSASIVLMSTPDLTLVDAPLLTTVTEFSFIDQPSLQTINTPLLDLIDVSGDVSITGGLLSSFNMSNIHVNARELAIEGTAMQSFSLRRVNSVASLRLTNNTQLSDLCLGGGAVPDSVLVEGSPLLSCSGLDTMFAVASVRSATVRGCGNFTAYYCGVTPPPPVAQPPVASCPDPGTPLNGSRDLQGATPDPDDGSFAFGVQLRFACDDDRWVLLGHVTITCRGTGAWSGSVPTCPAPSIPPTPSITGITPTLVPLRTATNVTLTTEAMSLPLRSVDTHDDTPIRCGDDQWLIAAPQAGSQRRRLLDGAETVTFEVAARTSPSYLVVTVTDGLGLQATDDSSLYFTDDCPTPGTFGIGLDCHLCPVGGYCPGGNRVWPLPGYWNEGEGSGHVLPCPEATACLGGRYSPCAVGYHAALCAACVERYYLRGTECVTCPPDSEETAIYIAAAIFFPLVTAAFCILPDYALDAFIVLIKILQLVRAGATQGGASLPEGFKRFVFYLSLVTFDFDFIKPACSFLQEYDYFYTLFWGNSVIACLLIFPPLIMLLILRLAIPKRREFYTNRLYRSVTIQMSLLYYVIAVRTMQSVTCIRIGDGKRLLADPTIPCASIYEVQIVGGLGLASFTTGMPIAVGYFVHRLAEGGTWKNPVTQSRYGFLFSDINMVSTRRHFYVILPFLQLMCASIAWTVIKVGTGPYILNIVAFALLLVVSVLFQPFARGLGNAVAVLSYGLGLGAVIIGLCSLGGHATSILVGWLVGGLVALFTVAVAILFTVKDVRDYRHRKKVQSNTFTGTPLSLAALKFKELTGRELNVVEVSGASTTVSEAAGSDLLERTTLSTTTIQSSAASSSDELISRPNLPPNVNALAAAMVGGGGSSKPPGSNEAALRNTPTSVISDDDSASMPDVSRPFMVNVDPFRNLPGVAINNTRMTSPLVASPAPGASPVSGMSPASGMSPRSLLHPTLDVAALEREMVAPAPPSLPFVPEEKQIVNFVA